MYGIFTYIYHKNQLQPFMQVNLPIPFFLWGCISYSVLRLLTLTERCRPSFRSHAPEIFPFGYSSLLHSPKILAVCFFGVICVKFQTFFVSSFSLSPKSQELLVSDLWFTVSQFWANDFFLFFHLFISPHFTQIEDRKSAGALGFCWAISVFSPNKKVGAVWQPGIALAFQIQVQTVWVGLVVFFGWSWCWWWIQKSGDK